MHINNNENLSMHELGHAKPYNRNAAKCNIDWQESER